MSHTKINLLTEDLRIAEKEIDLHYESNPLVKNNFAYSAWTLLAVAEDSIVVPQIRDFLKNKKRGLQLEALIADYFINNLNYPLRWLYNSCPFEGVLPFTFNDDAYQAAYNLFKLGENYNLFVVIFSYASQGFIELKLEGTSIVPSNRLSPTLKYEAYNRLIRSSSKYPKLNSEEFPAELILSTLRISDDRFKYDLNPKIVSKATQFFKPFLEPMFTLPNTWEFSNFSLEDFRKVFETMYAISYIHFITRLLAASRGCVGLGYVDGLLVMSKDEILRRIVRYSGLNEIKISIILEYLTYGSIGVTNPDPALQPLIQFNNNTYGIVPHLWINNAAERNLTRLINRIPADRDSYSRLVRQKEEVMRNRIKDSLSKRRFRLAYGHIPHCDGLPDIDLGLIDDSDKSLLLLELKWFIEPAEVREVIEKNEELRGGILQLLKIKKSFIEQNKFLFEMLNIDKSYEIGFAIVSENWIGLDNIQHPEAPIILERHLISKIKETKTLKGVIEWLQKRSYLPEEGVHFKIVNMNSSIGKWLGNWYGIEPLISEDFYPL